MVSVGGLMEEWSLHDPTIPKLPIWQYLHLHNQAGAPCGQQHLQMHIAHHPPWSSSKISFFLAPGMSCSFSECESLVSSCMFEDMAQSFGSSRPSTRLTLIWLPQLQATIQIIDCNVLDYTIMYPLCVHSKLSRSQGVPLLRGVAPIGDYPSIDHQEHQDTPESVHFLNLIRQWLCNIKHSNLDPNICWCHLNSQL